ncbi:MAG: HAMP domain-containing sensor histidine kinase, partial [bacterium]
AMQGPLDEVSAREALGSILEETERLTGLVDSLLVLVRGDSGGLRMIFETVDLSDVVREVTGELRVLAEEKNQMLAVDATAPVAATADPATVRQALINVIHNAIRYTPPGGRIVVTAAATADDRAVIDVIDNGPGIPKGERNRVFERFYRLDKARSVADGGAGLGLAIARWAIAANGGTIEFVDKTGAGAHCRITLAAGRS